ncbi:hypothetical protein [Pontibacter diazotrophicus]|uniref:hypothetical protein n=1 Tax=Pontibacter diazotrophicus TaxID=1400979 RepID=UPI0015F1BB9C|nr:hypothetical protein [Pontibacter diazotrophicus]
MKVLRLTSTDRRASPVSFNQEARLAVLDYIKNLQPEEKAFGTELPDSLPV